MELIKIIGSYSGYITKKETKLLIIITSLREFVTPLGGMEASRVVS